jgi:polyisoprenoid-binding protein YceI
MKTVNTVGKYFQQIAIVLILLSGIIEMQAQTNLSLKSIHASVKGTSTLHNWESKITKVDFKGASVSESNTLKAIENVEVKIAVKSIKSKEGKKMDEKTYEVFKSDKHPFIIYQFTDAKVKEDSEQSVTIEATGNLTMAGKTKLVSLTGNGKVLANGDLKITIEKKIKMSDFDMTPPTMFLGAINVGDEITVIFDMTLTKTK